MPDTTAQAGGATVATPTIRWAAFDEAAEAKGATTETAKAELIGVTRETLWRYRQGLLTPALDRAFHFAKVLEVPIDDLFEQVA